MSISLESFECFETEVFPSEKVCECKQDLIDYVCDSCWEESRKRNVFKEKIANSLKEVINQVWIIFVLAWYIAKGKENDKVMVAFYYYFNFLVILGSIIQGVIAFAN